VCVVSSHVPAGRAASAACILLHAHQDQSNRRTRVTLKPASDDR